MTLTLIQAYEKYFKSIMSISKLRSIVRQKLIPTVNIPGRLTYFNKETLEEWLKNGNKEEPPIIALNEIYGTLRSVNDR